jgi:hypothetical protein
MAVVAVITQNLQHANINDMRELYMKIQHFGKVKVAIRSCMCKLVAENSHVLLQACYAQVFAEFIQQDRRWGRVGTPELANEQSLLFRA